MNRREHFKNMNSYALYYGFGQAEQLAAFDFVIVEPEGQSREDIERMKQAGTLVIAYVSVAEILPSSAAFKLLKEEDFLIEASQKVMNEEFGTYLLNLHSRRWLGLLHHQIGRYLLHLGYDGVFLDTIGDVERNYLSAITQAEQIQSAVEFVSELREYFPDHIIIQNNGLEKLCGYTAAYIDAVMWENPPFLMEDSQDWFKDVSLQLQDFVKQFALKVLILLEESGDALQDEKRRKLAKNYTEDLSFPLYIAPTQYTAGINLEQQIAADLHSTGYDKLEEEIEPSLENDVDEDDTQNNATRSHLDDYFQLLIEQLQWMKLQSRHSLYEKTIKDHLSASLPYFYHDALATMLIEFYTELKEKEKLETLLSELLQHHQHHPAGINKWRNDPSNT